jgi:hypothetical protein
MAKKRTKGSKKTAQKRGSAGPKSKARKTKARGKAGASKTPAARRGKAKSPKRKAPATDTQGFAVWQGPRLAPTRLGARLPSSISTTRF